ncbi:MAG: alpha/beta hydrolase, partial [Mucilaginibacter sp.]|nr:alpha/beta hydrolase [Mucilaginibacter sp.]
MRFKLFVTIVLQLFIAFSISAQDIDYKGLPEWSWHKKGNTEYYLYTPKNMQAGKKYPFALFLHGCCGIDDHATLHNVVDAPARMWHGFGENKQRVPTYIIAPATSRGWAQHIPDLKAVMDSLVASQNADAQRIYICGFSMGAQGTFTFINQYPDYFAAAITMGMKFSGDSLKVKNIPMWVNQGETDYYSRPLRKQVKMLRGLNGDGADTGATFNTGVNPRYSNFKGFG